MDYDYFAEQLRQLQRVESTSTGELADLDPDMPPLEPISASSTPQTAMDVDDNGDEYPMASESSSRNDSQEVEMTLEAIDGFEDPPLPEIEPVATPVPRPNRRARVEDDDDDERDRRHPSQRITNPPSRQETPASTPLPAPRPQLFAFDFLNNHIPSSSPAAAPSSASPSSQPTQNASAPIRSSSAPQPTASTPQGQPRPAPGQPPFPGFAVSFDLDGIAVGPSFTTAPNANQQAPAPGTGPVPQAQGQGGPQTLADLFNSPTFLHDFLGIEPDIDDPDRADRLIKGLEEVPAGLVKRLERIGGIGATGTDLSGGDSGCAVCWEKLLPDEGVDEDANSKSKQKAAGGGEEKPLPTIVSLPCAHVFHTDCLRPWFSRPKQTTCPTCRFNIDPENLTFVPYRQRQPRPEPAGTSVPTSTVPPNAPPAPTPAPAAAASIPIRSEEGPSTADASASVPRSDGTSRVRSSPAGGPPPRRAGSEPPLNRAPHPPTGTGIHSDMFTIPGGHVVFVSQPIQINAQGQPVATALGQQGQQSAQSNLPAPQQSSSAPPPPDSTQPSSNPPLATSPSQDRPVFGPPLPPGMTFPTNLPDGMVAFDIAFPIPASLFGAFNHAGAGAPGRGPPTPQTNPSAPPPASQAQNTQPRPAVPPLRFPGGAFAGLNFGRPAGAAGAPGAVNMTDLFRSLFQPLTANPPAAWGPQSTQPSHPPQPSAPGAPPTATDPSPPTAPAPTNTQSPPPQPQPQARQTSPANTEENRTPPPLNAQEAFRRQLLEAFNNIFNPTEFLRAMFLNGLAGAGTTDFGAAGFGMPGSLFDDRRDVGPKKEWTPPPPPGPTLRQRIEKREHEAGLRCSDISCGIGPSDEEPCISEADAQLKQLSIHETGKDGNRVCSHSFHSSCLVSAERVARRGADASIVGSDVEVNCPVCRGAGSISKSDWDEGVHTLE
ncbi:hypothetical protein FA13DRAFT_1743388 [Coprinellus micaceus]|uniref:RING-type domain-containing protein n=1 Tax=Coprinellus micaceus TaxID=71717 RepID=A0A4Y7SEP7_COPMI|nr:hypothetical protein FA13DRAFT_1743388 [Coprinellus micaceus]